MKTFNLFSISNNLSKSGIIIFTLFYIFVTFISLQHENISLLFVSFILGGIILYLINPSLSFIFLLLPSIDPIGRFAFNTVGIVFILLALSHFFINLNAYVNLIKSDKFLVKLLFGAILFCCYQFYSFKETDGSSYSTYILSNIKLFLGIFLIIPSYYFAIFERKNLFVSILVLSVITLVYFYLSKIGKLDVFSVTETTRGLSSEITRLGVGFDFRYLIKIFAYFLPAFFLYNFKPKYLQRFLIADGILAYGILILILLRLDTIYTFIGGFMLVYFLKKDFGITQIFTKTFQFFLLLIVAYSFFFDEIKTLIDTYVLTADAFKGKIEDSSMEYRFQWIPILTQDFSDNYLFGKGFFSVSYANLQVWAAADLPLIASFVIYGFLGMILYIYRYFIIFRAFKNTTIPKQLFDKYRLEVILFYGLAVFFIVAVSLKFYLIFSELIYGWAYCEFAVLMGIFFGLRRFILIKRKFSENKVHIK